MNNLWRRIVKRKSSGKSSSDKDATQSKRQEPEPARNELVLFNATQNKPREAEPARNELVLFDATQNKPREPEPASCRLVLFGKTEKKFDLEDLLRATAEVLGKGVAGKTYKVDLEDGTTTVVVKRLKDVVLSAEDFRDAVEALGAMDHENLLPLKGYYYGKDEKLLLYDHMPIGSLWSQLHRYRESRGTPLSWEARLSIALGAARAIEYLHAQYTPHGNIKSSNVLLTPCYDARVSDYGLAPLTAMAGGTPAAMADVYGFGLLLLELLTGKLPSQLPLGEEGVDLPAWVQSVAHEEWNAQGFDVVERGMFELLEVAIRCVSLNPNGMSDVRKKIEDILRNELVLLGNPMKKFDLEDVSRASKQELGKGIFGTTYKVDLEDGTTTVILKMLENVVLSAKNFQDNVEAISAMDHENLLPLRGYYYSKDQKFLLYDYMPMGSLSSRLPPYGGRKGTPLSWEVRLSIALGAARAIEHLHAQQRPEIHHGNISSSKVLLMPSYEVRVSGYGLTLFTTPVLEGEGELRMADVHGFGELLLELLTGKPRTQALLKEQGQGLDLPRWVQDVLRDERFADVFDVDLIRSQYIEGGMFKLLDVAISCVSPNLYERPRMPEVRRKIEQLCSPRGQRDGGIQPDKVREGTKDRSSLMQLDRDLQLNQFSQVNYDMYPRKPPDGVLEVSERVYGENTESLRGEEIAAVTETNMELTPVSDSASSSAVNNGSVEDTAAGVCSSVQFPDIMQPKQEKVFQQDSSPSLTSMSSGFDYDVFLSFRGPDTRLGITSILYNRLLGARIHTFKDDEELRVGEEFGPELLKAISQSKVAIPIFSKGYASSKWCLNELVQMVECSTTRRQKVMPFFYDVSPAEVRHQIGSYEEAFLSHKEKFGANVSKWKAALNHVANLNGWDNLKKNRYEGELVDKIVQEVIHELKTAYLLVTDCLVGVENHVKEIDTLMCCDSEDIRILGIHGMGGVGKTTLAKIIYNQLSHHFEACCFLSNIRRTSELKGIEGLQNQLISDLLKKQWSNISNVEEGIKMIKERLCGKKVLVLLDDVNEMTHWDALIGKPAWFGLGSRIIITSRNRDIVDVTEACYSYELISMNFNQSLQLFCKHAFGRDYPSDDYVAFSTEVVKSTGGLPLALEAIGKLLPRRSKDVWHVILKKLKQVPLNEVKRKLKFSYDALDDSQKHIFLDIACLFTGFDQRIVLHSWKDSNLFPEEGLEVLQKMSLIKIGEDNKLWMHDQLRGFGRDIVRRECNEEQEKQSQLWNPEEGLEMMMETKGTKKFNALCRKFDPQLLYHFANEVERLSSPRYPEVRVFQEHWRSNDFPANLQHNMLMLSKLIWLSWDHFALEVKIASFSMMNIVILHLGDCPNLIDVQSIEGLVSLRTFKLIKIPLLERLPNLSNLKKLNELHLGHCHNLIDVKSIEVLGNLETLKLIEIPQLKRLPDLSNLKELTKLQLRYCHGLAEIKSFEGLENLMMLRLDELPLLGRLPNLSSLKKLTQLDVRRCRNLVKIQGRLDSLEDLCIQGCRSLEEVLDPVSSFKKLKSLRIHDCEKLHLDSIWVSKLEISDRVYENSTCKILSKIGICVCQLGRQFFLPSFQ